MSYDPPLHEATALRGFLEFGKWTLVAYIVMVTISCWLYYCLGKETDFIAGVIGAINTIYMTICADMVNPFNQGVSHTNQPSVRKYFILRNLLLFLPTLMIVVLLALA